MNRIRDTKLVERLTLKLQQLLATMVDSSTDKSIFPLGMFHRRKRFQLFPDFLIAQSIFRQRQVARDARSGGYKLGFEFGDRLRDLQVDLRFDARKREEDLVCSEAQIGVEFFGRAEDAAAAQLIK